MATNVYDMIREVGIGMLGENSAGAQALLDKQSELANQNVDLATQAMPAALAVSGQKHLGDLQAQDAGIAVREQLGNNPNDPNSLLSILVQDFRENTLKAREQQIAIAERKQVGLFDDAPQFLINQVLLPDQINAYQATLGRAKTAQDGIAAMQSLTTASAQAARATAQTLTKDSIAQQAVLDSAMLSQKINALKHDALGVDLEGIKLANQNNAQMVQYSMQEHSLRMQDANFALAQEEHQLRLAKIKEEKIADQEYVKIVNAGRASFELPPINLETAQTLSKSPEQRAKLDKFFNRGIDLAATDSKAVSVGYTPGEAIWNTLQVGGLKGDQHKQARDYMERLAREVASQLPPGTKMTPETIKSIQSSINDKLYGPIDPKTGKRLESQGEWYKMITDVERPGSIFKAPDLPVLASSPSIKNNPLYESVIAPAIAAGVTKSDPASLYAQTNEALKRGLINENQLALGLADLYKSVSAVTYTQSGAARFGLTYHPAYMAKVDSPMGTLQQDWSKPENWIMYHNMSKASNTLGRGSAMEGMWR